MCKLPSSPDCGTGELAVITIGLPCQSCGCPTMPHCASVTCRWSRCPKCHSYGVPGGAWVEWDKGDYINPYTLNDVKTAPPKRTLPDWLMETYGERRFDGERW